MAVEAVWTNRKIFAVSHLSGSRISADDWEILQGLFENELSSTHLLQVG